MQYLNIKKPWKLYVNTAHIDEKKQKSTPDQKWDERVMWLLAKLRSYQFQMVDISEHKCDK